MTYNDLAELFKREGGDSQVCFSVISQNQILFGNNDTNKHIISFTNEEPIKWVKEVQEESVSEDLDEEIEEYWKNAPTSTVYFPMWEHFQIIARHFANWQKNQTMKDAYKGYVSYIRDDSEAIVYLKDSCITMPSYFPKSNLKDGDNVRILVIKDE